MDATPQEKVVGTAQAIREELKTGEQVMREFVQLIKDTPETELHDKGECIAQAMLALRACEESRMRFGKVIQYATTGESVYEKKD